MAPGFQTSALISPWDVGTVPAQGQAGSRGPVCVEPVGDTVLRDAARLPRTLPPWPRKRGSSSRPFLRRRSLAL